MAVVDTNNGGRALTYADVLERAAARPDIDTVVTGHGGGSMTVAGLREHAAFVRQFVNDVAAAKKSGRSVDDVTNTWKCRRGSAATRSRRSIAFAPTQR